MNAWRQTHRNLQAAIWVLRATAISCLLFGLFALLGCKYLAAEENPSWRDKGWAVPPCDASGAPVMGPPGTSCRRRVVREEQTACDKRFGKKLCGGKPE